MPTPTESLEEIRDAIGQLRAAAAHDHDVARGEVARKLTGKFDGVDDAEELRIAAAEALQLYRGGAGSFSDTGTAVMDAAVDRLRRALDRAIKSL